ncbi:immunoglobulin-like domain-containing protein [Geojedonia litorea]|uniref:Immunoglobulin-like domain-containing protein n=1 Tax=Geojedonia litorea TaxID=1268269 RepID=A0ABV9N5F0_9FLAO
MKLSYASLLFFLCSTIYTYGQCTITCPANVTVTCPYDVPFISPSAYTNCGTIVLQTWTMTGATAGSSPATGINDASLEIFQYGVTTVTYNVKDNLGNTASCNFTVTITDSQPPLLICPTDITINNNPGLCSAVVNDFGFMSAWDNCSGITLELVSGLPRRSAFPVGTTTNVFKFTDAAGNSSTCSFKINVIDNEAPTVNCPANIVVNTSPGLCNTYVTVPMVTASDNCSIASITNNFNGGGANASGTYPLGTSTVTYTVTDTSNKTTTCSIDVTVVNSQNPVITLNGPNVITLEACSTYTELGATATDNCLGDITSSIIVNTSALNTNVVGSYIVSYKIVNASGVTTAQVNRTVNVADTTIPYITLNGPNPLNIGDCATYTELGAVASDPCFGNITGALVIDNSTVNSGVLGSYNVTYNVMDAQGNAAAQVTRVVNILEITAPIINLIGDDPQIIDACTSYIELGATATDPCFNTDYTADIVIDTSNVDTSTVGTYIVTYNVSDNFGNAAMEVVRAVEVVDATIIAQVGPDISNTICTETSLALTGNPVSGSSTGLWSVTSGQTSGFYFSDPSSPTSLFTGDVGENYELTWSIYNPCGISSDTINVSFMGCSALDFDGIDDNITFKNNYNFNGDFTIEVWVKEDLQNGNIQTIFSKRIANNQINGYDLRVVNNYVSFNWNSGLSLVSPYQITTGKWHHVAVTYAANTYRLYIDGVLMNTASGSLPITNSAECIVGAMDQTSTPPFKPTNYFTGGMDELRIWNTALSVAQIRQMMNQEIEADSGTIKGSIVPLIIQGLTWNDLKGYYQMNQSKDLSAGNLVSNSSTLINGKLRYMTTLQPETAPQPYVSKANGQWTDANTWLYGNSQNLPNSMGIDGTTAIDWNIVKTGHNISSGNRNIVLSGLFVNVNTLSVENTNPLDGQSLRVTKYLKIDGMIDLVGESQLLQDMGSVLDNTGIGSLQRDQQGTSNLFNFNYWGSPVNQNGSNYTVKGVLNDGTNPNNPLNLQWTTSYNANASLSPIAISNRWLYSFENFALNSYADWRFIGENGSLKAGLGFTMKGSGAVTSEQNYVFEGRPNNGTISIPINAGNEALIGNPYPSAIDAREFILDNASSLQGALYFWEHYVSNATHKLEEYEGGYAIYNLIGGNPAISPPEVSGNGTPSKIPERYIPVAQGFFVRANNSTGGNIVFENDQRVFVKESVTGAVDKGSVFFRKKESSKERRAATDDDDIIKRVRIQFKSPEGALRHLLLGFVPHNKATDGFDYGYDALNTEDLPNDMSWIIEGEKYVIQGVGDFDNSKQYPLGVFLKNSGTIEIALTGLENFDTIIDVYIFDALLNQTFKIDGVANFAATLNPGDHLDRFYVAFKPMNTLSLEDALHDNIVLKYLNTSQELYIYLPLSVEARQISMFNLAGQKIKSWALSKMQQSTEIRIPVSAISDGVYILKLETTSGSISKKVVVKQ